MAKKRGRPPKTPSSSAKKPQSIDPKTIEEDLQQGLVQLDDDDLENLDSLSPKKVMALLKNLDALREKEPRAAPVDNNESASREICSEDKEVQSKDDDTVIVETQNTDGGKGSEAGVEVSSDEMPELEDIPWTPVKTRNKSRRENKGNDSVIKNMASKANRYPPYLEY
ncbi:hypothetical protein RIF29_00220 [Crotalaria pallida]|uniref:Uncharacterized protein n=1 Tax=Crotalaria pallida TaxID=3830 RepID=A0AAN9IVX2_CROPI